jgi:hypothetical protein
MIKLPENTTPEFVSQLATELSVILKDKYNKPIGSGKLINDLSDMFGHKDWNTLKAVLSPEEEVFELHLFNIIARDLLAMLKDESLREYWKNSDEIYGYFTTGEANTLFDILFYRYDLDDKINTYKYKEDHNYHPQIPPAFKDKTFEKLNDLRELHFTDKRSYHETDNLVCTKSIQNMMKELLIAVCDSVDDDFGDTGDNNYCICQVDFDTLSESFEFYLNYKLFVHNCLF